MSQAIFNTAVMSVGFYPCGELDGIPWFCFFPAFAVLDKGVVTPVDTFDEQVTEKHFVLESVMGIELLSEEALYFYGLTYVF